MKNTILSLIGTGLLVTGLTFAQTPAPTPTPNATPGAGRPMRARMAHRMMANLNLTDDQKQQAKAIFQAGRQEAQPVQQQLRQARQDMQAAVKSNAPQTEIDRLSTNVGNLTGQLATLHARNMAKFYAILTPEQQQKVDQRGARLQNSAARGWRKAPPPQVQQ